MSPLLLAPLFAMSVTIILVPLLARYAGPLKLVDFPDARKVHTKPIPRVGGIAMAAALLAALLIWGAPLERLGPFCFALAVLLAFGVLDDRFGLEPLWKFAGQVVAAAIVMHFGGVGIRVWHATAEHPVAEWVAIPLTLTFIVGATNAINLADGLDGLAGGVALLCLAGLALLGLTAANPLVALTAMIAVGTVLGFLCFNIHPARVFMGDAGSQVIGFTAAVLSLIVTQDDVAPFSATLPLLLLGIPIIDTTLVMVERMLEGKSPFRADKRHIHHRLLALGFRHEEAVVVLCGSQAVLLFLAWRLRYSSDLLILALFAALAAATVVALHGAARYRWEWRSGDAAQAGPRWLRRRFGDAGAGAATYWAERLLVGAMLAYVALIAVNGVPAPVDVRALAAAAALVVLSSTWLLKPGRGAVSIQRGALYIVALIALYLDRPGELANPLRLGFEYAIFGAIAVSVVVRLWLSMERRMSITPLDVGVLGAAVLLPTLPESVLGDFGTGWALIKAIALLYAIETVSVSTPRHRGVVAGTSLLFLVAVAWRVS